MKRRAALVGSLAALATPVAARAQTVVDLQLVLAVDVSRSIDEVEAELQRRGYVEALTSERVIDAILSGEHKRIDSANKLGSSDDLARARIQIRTACGHVADDEAGLPQCSRDPGAGFGQVD